MCCCWYGGGYFYGRVKIDLLMELMEVDFFYDFSR